MSEWTFDEFNVYFSIFLNKSLLIIESDVKLLVSYVHELLVYEKSVE